MSTASWLSAIGVTRLPEGWSLASIGSRYEVQLGKMLNAERAAEPGDSGASPYLRNVNVQWDRIDTSDLKWMCFDENDRAKYELRGGDLLVCEGGEIGRCAVWTGDRDDCFFQKALMRVRSRFDDEVRWLALCLRVLAEGGVLTADTDRSTIDHLPAEKLRTVRVPQPPVQEQRAILNALDAETARLDTTIALRLRQIELLRERAISAANHLALSGPRSCVAPKPSRVPTIGDLPERWRVLRNKVFLSEVTDLSADGSEELLTVSHITGVTARAEKTEVTMFRAESTVGYKRCIPGDLVINTMWAWMGALGVVRQPGIVSPSYGVYRFDPMVADPRYFEHVYRSPAYVAEMTRYSKGVWTSRLRLYPDAFLALSAPVPPLAEQREIVAAIDAATRRDNELANVLRSSVAVLRERRQAVITAAITGTLQVPESPRPNATV